MKIRLRRNVLISGAHRGAGEVVEVSDELGTMLIAWERAEALEPGGAEAAIAEPEAETAVDHKRVVKRSRKPAGGGR
jgi:hypothetical protein